jgi:L-fuconolactonase
MRVDAHHHLWQLARYEYPWMPPGSGPLRRDFALSDLAPELAARNIDRTILVQTICSLDESRWFLQLAQQSRQVAGVVGWVDLADPGVGPTLDALRPLGPLVGVRHQVHDEPDLDWLARPGVRRGLAEVARRDLVYDLLLRPAHLPAALAVATALPQLRFVVDHLAKPAIARRGWDDWAPWITRLARLPNVCCKLSGMITEADWTRWRPADLRPYVDHVLHSFGPQRAMFGSDWPVCLLAGAYAQVVDALQENLAGLSPAESAEVWGLAAARWYRLPAPAAPPSFPPK